MTTVRVTLPFGVYEVMLNGQNGIANYGLAPTLGERSWRSPVLEVHLLSALPAPPEPRSSDAAAVEIIRFIRPERKFATVDELKRQIAADCAAVR